MIPHPMGLHGARIIQGRTFEINKAKNSLNFSGFMIFPQYEV